MSWIEPFFVRPEVAQTEGDTEEFQILDIVCLTDNELNALTQRQHIYWKKEAIRKDPRVDPGGRAHVFIFGTNAQGASVSARVEGLWPFFDICVPRSKKFEICYDCEDEPLAVAALTNALMRKKNQSSNSFQMRVTVRDAYHMMGYRFGFDGKPISYKWVRLHCETWEGYKEMIRVASADWFARHVVCPRDSTGHVRPFTIASDKLPLVNQFSVISGVCPSKWARFPRNVVASDSYITTSALAIQCEISDVEPLNERDDLAPKVCVSFDIECIPGGNAFPKSHKPADVVAQISVSICLINSPGVVRCGVLCLHDTAPVEGVVIASFPDECALLQGFRDLIQHPRVCPDWLMGYNIFNFDWKYLADRALRVIAFSQVTEDEAVASWRSGMPARRAYHSVKYKYENRLKVLKDLKTNMSWQEKNTFAAMATTAMRQWKDFAGVDTFGFPSMPHELRAITDYDDEESVRQAHRYFSSIPGGAGLTFHWCSRITKWKTNLTLVVLESAAMGSNELWRFDTPGRCSFDLWLYIKNTFKLSDTSLKAVCKLYLKDSNKVDLPYEEMFRLWRLHTPEARSTIARYCAMDANLPIYLCETLSIFISLTEMSKKVYTSMPALVTRGQTVKVYSQIAMYSREKYALNSLKLDAPDTFKGATVLDPIPGYHEQPTATLDFASLYPSIMQAHNLCFTTYIERRFHKKARMLAKQGKMAIEEHEVVDEETGKSETHIFVRRQTHRGLLPEMLAFLFASRKAVKREMKKAPKDSLLRKIKDGEQLALKISMNSIYGVTGAKTGKLGFYPYFFRDYDGRPRNDRQVRRLPPQGVQRHCNIRGQCFWTNAASAQTRRQHLCGKNARPHIGLGYANLHVDRKRMDKD